ncbi:MAG: CBS domain-containing protein [Bacillota bacterium]
MELIISHQSTDFDALAAMIAAKNLYPEAKAVFAGTLQDHVKDFMALYRDEIEILSLKDINLEKIEKIIIVDTANRKALGRLNNKVDLDEIEVIVYDHHPHEKKDWIDLDLSQEIGAATSILVNKLVADGKKLNPLEATICALGIYADTGSLTYDSSTYRDAEAVSYLLKSGANLDIIRQFLEEALNAEQQIVFDKLLENRERVEIKGINIDIFYHEQDKYVTGLNNICEKIKDIYSLSTVFIIMKMGEKIELIGRSNDDAVNIGKICESFGGGGHKAAGAAQLKKDISYVKRKLKKLLNLCVSPVKKVSSIMSTPVRTISPDTSIKEAEEFMEKYGHNGVIVCGGEKIAGIFSRRDLDKVKGHDLMHAPVKGYMSKDVITVNVDAPIKEAQKLMVKYNIGRLPVIKNKKLVGIVTRSDILSSYYEQETPHKYQNRYGSSLVNINKKVKDISHKLDYFPEDIIDILKTIGQTAFENDQRAFLIGGMVRDLLLGRKNHDLDIVIEGDLKEFLADLRKKINIKVKFNKKFGTATINLNSDYSIDFATSRKEKYFFAGALPEVEKAKIIEDLFRRDYSINALALSLNPDSWGKLYDYFNGIDDLENAKLKALHRFSFLDDPTRIIRGIRLAINLDFRFEEETDKLMKEALKLGDFSELSPSRVFKEIKILFNNSLSNKLINYIEMYPIFKLLDVDFEFKERYKKAYKEIEKYKDIFNEENYNINKELVALAIFMNDIPEKKYKELNLTAHEREIFSIDINNLEKKLINFDNRVDLTTYINNLNKDILLYVLVMSEKKELKDNVKLYFEKLLDVDLKVNGYDLIEMGLEAGPKIQEILDKVWKEKLNNNLKSKKEEKEYAKKLINEEME